MWPLPSRVKLLVGIWFSINFQNRDIQSTWKQLCIVWHCTCHINIISLFLRPRWDATRKLYHNVWCYYFDVIASAFLVHTHKPSRNHRGNKFNITVSNGSPIGPKTFRFHFGETIFRLNSHRNPYIYGRHVDTNGTEHTRFTIKLSWIWLTRSNLVILSQWAREQRMYILILFDTIIELWNY